MMIADSIGARGCDPHDGQIAEEVVETFLKCLANTGVDIVRPADEIFDVNDPETAIFND
jgi:pyruvate/oxaloacetate carboxyltransferase